MVLSARAIMQARVREYLVGSKLDSSGPQLYKFSDTSSVNSEAKGMPVHIGISHKVRLSASRVSNQFCEVHELSAKELQVRTR